MANDKQRKKRRKLNVGDTVRLAKGNKHATVRALLTDIEGGILLSDYLDGFRYWNVDDLRIVKRGMR